MSRRACRAFTGLTSPVKAPIVYDDIVYVYITHEYIVYVYMCMYMFHDTVHFFHTFSQFGLKSFYVHIAAAAHAVEGFGGEEEKSQGVFGADILFDLPHYPLGGGSFLFVVGDYAVCLQIQLIAFRGV